MIHNILTGNIGEITINNNNYRKVINTTKYHSINKKPLEPNGLLLNYFN